MNENVLLGEIKGTFPNSNMSFYYGRTYEAVKKDYVELAHILCIEFGFPYSKVRTNCLYFHTCGTIRLIELFLFVLSGIHVQIEDF